MKNRSKFISALIILALLVSLAGCASSAPAATASPEVVETAAPTPEAEPEIAAEPAIDSSLPVNIMVLNGTTGFGMAQLIDKAANGTASLNYSISVETDASNVTSALINGSADIAALPTNAASVVYNKTGGEVQLLALNTLGVLYLVTDDSVSIESFANLKDTVVYAPAQNPSFIFSYLCEQNGLKVGEDIVIDNSYAQPADLRTALAAGEVSIAVLPEPMLTMAKAQNDKLVTALDLTAEWDKVAPEGSLVQGCVVVRREFAAQHPVEVAEFLKEYAESIDFLSGDAAEVGALIEATGVFANGKVAAKALPGCNVCFIAGEAMKGAMSDFLSIMFETAPASIGGAIPADDFYYIG